MIQLSQSKLRIGGSLLYHIRGAERNIRCLASKYVLIDDELYRRTAEDLLLKCLDSDQARVAMGEVHEGICGTHQSAPKMKWLLRRAGFY